MNNKEQVTAAAETLGVPYSWLDSLITAESGHNPKAINPHTNAIGLIQWMNPRATDLGYENKEELYAKNPTYSQQIGLIVRDLKRYMPFKSKQEFYLSVFMPAWRKKNPNTKFPDYVQDVNAGIVTINDYVLFVERQAGKKKILKQSPLLLGLLALAAYAVLKSPKSKNKR